MFWTESRKYVVPGAVVLNVLGWLNEWVNTKHICCHQEMQGRRMKETKAVELVMNTEAN